MVQNMMAAVRKNSQEVFEDVEENVVNDEISTTEVATTTDKQEQLSVAASTPADTTPKNGDMCRWDSIDPQQKSFVLGDDKKHYPLSCRVGTILNNIINYDNHYHQDVLEQTQKKHSISFQRRFSIISYANNRFGLFFPNNR
jgi:hypothetical protein